MRWKADPLKDMEGQQRVVSKFLLFPKCLDGEWRWLERSNIVQQVCKLDVGGSCQWGCYAWQWIDISWNK